ncbi:MAG TPA: hypothetical protein VJ796_09145 [Acidimicrobiia bacterium]|nr:hypothetical protein [Acidimicrobiia bacterium]
MRLFVRLVALALVALLALILLGPMAPQGTFFSDFSLNMREALNIHWGMPLGYP